MFCINCGNPMNPGEVFCTNCGAKQDDGAVQAQSTPQTPAEPQVVLPPQPEPVIQQAPAEVPQVIPQNAVMVTNWKNSFFDGTMLGLLGVNIVVALVSSITLGFGAPAMTCYRLRWIYKHTCIGGYRLKFTGKGGQLFGRYLLWGFLIIITFGIYGLWVPIKHKKWETSHVEIDSVIVQ